MISVVSGGAAERIAARIFLRVPRPGSGTPAKYSSIFFGFVPVFETALRFVPFDFFTRPMLQNLPHEVHAMNHALFTANWPEYSVFAGDLRGRKEPLGKYLREEGAGRRQLVPRASGNFARPHRTRDGRAHRFHH